MNSLIEMKEEMKRLQSSESWHNGSGVTARQVDKLRAEISQTEMKLKQACRCFDKGGGCDSCLELNA